MLQDLRFALRLFRKHPAPVAIAIGGLAVAIAVVTSVFSIINATVLRPYGMDDPASLVSVAGQGESVWHGLPYAQFLRMREGTALATLDAALDSRVRFSTSAIDDGVADRPMLFVSGGYMSMLGGRPALGRTLQPSDDVPGAAPVVVVSDRTWKTQLRGDPAVVGTIVRVNGAAATLVGVLQPHFTGPEKVPPSIWAPLAAADDLGAGAAIDGTSGGFVRVIARLARGASMRALQDNLSSIAAASSSAGAMSALGHPGRQGIEVYSAASQIAGQGEADVYFVLASITVLVGLVLALACANAANLLMAAALIRVREVGVRLAMGATRRRLVRQLVTESLLLGAIAGGVGVLLSMWIVPTFSAIVALVDAPPEVSALPDARVLIFAVAVSLVCGLGAGLSPARYGARGNVLAALQSGSGAGSAGAASRSRLRTSFIGFQAAASMFLLVSAAVLTRTVLVTTRVEIGFDPDRLIAVTLKPLRAGIDQPAYLHAALAALQEVPAVERAAVTRTVPFGNREFQWFSLNGRRFDVAVNRSDAGLLEVLALRVVRGRGFTESEVTSVAPVALVSEAFAHAYFGDADPVGQFVSNDAGGPSRPTEPATIVGVVADAMTTRPDRPSAGTIYRPLDATVDAGVFTDRGLAYLPDLIVRTATPGVTARAIEDALRRIDPGVRPTTSFVGDWITAYFDGKRMLAWVVGPTALLALLLAVLGVYGVTAFGVGQRMHEVSVRMAVGASSADVLRLLVHDSMRPVIVGLGAGLLLAVLMTRLMARPLMISGISPADPIAIGFALSALLACALVAVIMPARRASRADPARLLRQA